MIYKTKKQYTISYLLSRQPKAFKKHKDFLMLINFFNVSQSLKKAHFSRKCYSLLNNSKIIPEKLEAFYQNFGLPKNGFFPLFLKIKKEYLDKRIIEKKKRDEFILKKMSDLTEDVKIYIKYLAKYEKNLNSRKRFPVWGKVIYPKTKKNAEKFAKYKRIDWAELFFNFVKNLNLKYKKDNSLYGNKIVALFILELPIKKHSPELIKSQYRKLSKKYHPDAGGNSENFNLLQKARGILLD